MAADFPSAHITAGFTASHVAEHGLPIGAQLRTCRRPVAHSDARGPFDGAVGDRIGEADARKVYSSRAHHVSQRLPRGADKGAAKFGFFAAGSLSDQIETSV